jgi:iron complex transport system substrate-binding protein
MHHPLTRFALSALIAGVAIGAAACGGDDSSGAGTTAVTAPSTSESVVTTSAIADAFPRTVAHFFGETTIEEAPARVITLGVTDADVVLALGVVPVGFSGFAFLETGFGPWAEALVGDETPLRLDAIELNLEAIAGLAPDLIIGVSAGFDEAMYEQLSQIAPTVGRPAGTAAYQVPRKEATMIIAEALGVPDRGAELEAAADAAFAAAIAEHPDFAGKTVAVVSPYDGVYGVYTERDGRGQLMAGLGMSLPDGVAALDTADEFVIELSPEQVELIDGDVVVMLADDPADRAVVDGDAVLQAVPVIAAGRMVVPDTDTRGAMTSNTVLSIPYAVAHLVPQLAAALAG